MRIEDLEGFIDLPSGYRILDEKPIDCRFVGKSKEFLDSIIEIGAAYPGLRVFIVDDNKSYIYKKEDGENYKFTEEGTVLSEEEKAVLSSGLTKEKLSKIEEEIEDKFELPKGGLTEEYLSSGVKSKLDKAQSSLQKEDFDKIPQWALKPNKPVYTADEIFTKDSKNLQDELNSKVTKVGSKVLSDENFSSSEKLKLSGIKPGAEPNTISKIYLGGVEQVPNSEKEVRIPLAKVNGATLLQDGNLGLVETGNSNQVIDGEKTFNKLRISNSTEKIDFNSPSKNKVTSEYQVVEAIKDGQDQIREEFNEIDASTLYGVLSNRVTLPDNINTKGNADTATKLKNPVEVKVTGKATSDPISFDGSRNLNLEITQLSSDPKDYPTLNQDTTGNAATADKLKNSRKLKVNLSNTGNSTFDGSSDQENISVTGRLNLGSLPSGSGTGTKRRVLSTKIGSGNSEDLGLYELNPEDVGLGNLSSEYTGKTEFEELKDRVDRISNLGNFIGSYATYTDLPENISNIKETYGVIPTVNDFVTVRGGNYPNGSGILPGSVTQWTIADISGSGDITWGYESTYSQDITGKLDKLTGTGLKDRLPKITESGQLTNSDIKISDLICQSTPIDPKNPYSRTYKDKILSSLEPDGIIERATKLSTPEGNLLNIGKGNRPVYFKDGLPVELDENTLIPITNKDGYLKGPKGEDLKVSESNKAKSLNLGSSVGSANLPIYFNKDGIPEAFTHPISEIAFKGVRLPEDWKKIITSGGTVDGEAKSLKVVAKGLNEYDIEGGYNYVPGDYFYLELGDDTNGGGNTSNSTKKEYFLLVNTESTSLLFKTLIDQLGQGLGGLIHTVPILSKGSIVTLGYNDIPMATEKVHNLSNLQKIKIFEIQGKLYNTHSDYSENTNDNSTLDYNLVETSCKFKITQNSSVEIYLGPEYYYDNTISFTGSNKVCQGIYWVELSE